MYPVDLYYFINTKGQIHDAFVGADKERDVFTKKTHNQFNTKEEAIYRAKPYWKAAKSIEILTVETKTYIEKTQETIK